MLEVPGWLDSQRLPNAVAVVSALTTATAFGSLWLSSHPGTSSMGKLMALALVTTMCAAVLFQPVLMGPPRDKKKKPEVPLLLEAPKADVATAENTASS